jgi:hypothetical protein
VHVKTKGSPIATVANVEVINKPPEKFIGIVRAVSNALLKDIVFTLRHSHVYASIDHAADNVRLVCPVDHRNDPHSRNGL